MKELDVTKRYRIIYGAFRSGVGECLVVGKVSSCYMCPAELFQHTINMKVSNETVYIFLSFFFFQIKPLNSGVNVTHIHLKGSAATSG